MSQKKSLRTKAARPKSKSRYGSQANLELAKIKLEVAKLSDQSVENKRKRDEQIDQMQKESKQQIREIQNESRRQIEEIQKESKRQFDLLLRSVLGKKGLLSYATTTHF